MLITKNLFNIYKIILSFDSEHPIDVNKDISENTH